MRSTAALLSSLVFLSIPAAASAADPPEPSSGGGVTIGIDPDAGRARAELSIPRESAPGPRTLEITVDSSTAVGLSSWRGDPAAIGSLRAGLRIHDLITPYLSSRLGYAGVNQRALLGISLGVQAHARIGKARPYVRLGLLHQHEVPVDAIQEDAAGALFGTGKGVRHRGGGEAGLGLDYPLYTTRKLELVGSADVAFPWLPDEKGPSLYVLGGLGLGVRYSFL